MKRFKRWMLYFTLTVIILGLSDGLPKLSSAELYHDQVAVLMYHHVHDEDTSSSTVTTALFHDQLAYLQSKGYRFISLTDFKTFMQGGPVPPNAVLVTFDDGYKSFYDNAYPVLTKLNIPAVNFVVTKDLAEPLAPPIPSLSKDEIAQMLHAPVPGMFEFECHSDDLHHKIGNNAALTSRTDEEGVPISDEAYMDKIRTDTAACSTKLNELYGKTDAEDSYAYPFGIFSGPALGILKEAGFRYGFTIIGEMATRRSDPMQIPRINAGNPNIRPENLHQIIVRRIEAVSSRNAAAKS